MTKHQLKVQRDVFKVLAVALLVALAFGWVKRSIEVSAEMVHPQPHNVIVVDKPITVIKEAANIDTWIGKYADKYANDKKNTSYLRYQLHCLANKESGHRYNDHRKCGDGGLSCGLMQFREGTWKSFRSKMMKLGLVSEIGSLWNNEQVVETTAWALANGYENHWGPIVNKGACK
jgi:hypothetical protein